MWDTYINFCTVIGVGIVTVALTGVAAFIGILIFTYLLDKSSGGA